LNIPRATIAINRTMVDRPVEGRDRRSVPEVDCDGDGVADWMATAGTDTDVVALFCWG